MGENLGVPTISMEMPIDPWLAGGPYEWAFHSFWMIENKAQTFIEEWLALGFEGATVGFLFPEDPDGIRMSEIYGRMLPEAGFSIVDTGRYPPGTADFTSVINRFIADGVEIITGAMSPPDFPVFAVQAQQMGFWPEIVTIARAYLFPAAVNAFGPEIGNGLTSEVWWCPNRPFTCSVTGMTPRQLVELYEAEFNHTWSPVIGYKHAPMAQAIDVLQRAGTLDRYALRDAIASTDLQTIVGHVKYNDQHVSVMPVSFGQWQMNNATGELELHITNSPVWPIIPTTSRTFLIPPIS
jgi:branched-chain amino acid transport system substrate-binding protein